MLKLLYTIFMAFWRRGFGCDGWHLPILKNRFVLHILGFLATFLLCTLDKHFNYYTSAWVAVWLQIFWALGHGYAYDISKAGQPDEKMLKRYKKAIGYKFLCKIFPKDEHYGMCFDFILLAIRYTWPLIPICLFFNPVFMCLGLVITSLYLIYRFCPIVRKIKILDVEIWAGFFTGLFVSFL